MERTASYEAGRELGGKIWAERDKLSFQDFLKLLNDTVGDLFADGTPTEENSKKLDGLFAYIQEKEVEDVNLKQFFADIDASKSDVDYEDLIRIVDLLLPAPADYDSMVGDAVEIPVGLRPHISMGYGDEGVIGRFYLQDSGMHMWLPHCDVYSEDNPEELLEEEVSLLYETYVTSEILLALQAVIDPMHKNKELEQAIAQSLAVENATGNALYGVLAKHRLPVVSLKACSRSARCCNNGTYGDLQYLFLADGTVNGIAETFDNCFFLTELLPSSWNYNYIIQHVKATVNIAKSKR